MKGKGRERKQRFAHWASSGQEAWWAKCCLLSLSFPFTLYFILSLFSNVSKKQTHEADGMKTFLATMPFFSQMVYEEGEEGHCCQRTFSYHWLRASPCLTRWKRGRELVHCLYKKTRIWIVDIMISLWCAPFHIMEYWNAPNENVAWGLIKHLKYTVLC